MIRNAESHADEVPAAPGGGHRGPAETLAYQTERSLKEHRDKLDEARGLDDRGPGHGAAPGAQGHNLAEIRTTWRAAGVLTSSPRCSTPRRPSRRRRPRATAATAILVRWPRARSSRKASTRSWTSERAGRGASNRLRRTKTEPGPAAAAEPEVDDRLLRLARNSESSQKRGGRERQEYVRLADERLIGELSRPRPPRACARGPEDTRRLTRGGRPPRPPLPRRAASAPRRDADLHGRQSSTRTCTRRLPSRPRRRKAAWPTSCRRAKNWSTASSGPPGRRRRAARAPATEGERRARRHARRRGGLGRRDQEGVPEARTPTPPDTTRPQGRREERFKEVQRPTTSLRTPTSGSRDDRFVFTNGRAPRPPGWFDVELRRLRVERLLGDILLGGGACALTFTIVATRPPPKNGLLGCCASAADGMARIKRDDRIVITDTFSISP